jgi:hypothetical protein
MMKKLMCSLLIACIMLSTYTACENAEDPVTTDEEINHNATNHEDSTDYYWASESVIPVVLNGTSITASNTGLTISGCKLTITKSGTYSITGTLADGQILVNTADNGTVRLILNGIHVTCSTGAPLYIPAAKKVVVLLADQTENFLTDAKTYIAGSAGSDEPNAAIFSMADLTFFGNGALTVKGNYQDGIASKDGLIIKSGTITVNAVDDGIRGKDYLYVKSGMIQVISGGDGLKSDNEEDTDLGFITVEAGTVNVTSGGDAISAESDIIIKDGDFNLTSGGGSGKAIDASLSAKGIKAAVVLVIDGGTYSINSADDALHSNGKLTVNGGTFSLSAGDDGVHAETSVLLNSGDLTIVKSVEGIESPFITVNSGNVSVTASDDGFNATHGVRCESNDGSFLYLHGGNIFVNTSRGDGLDSNGSIEMTAGTVIVHGPQSQPEVGMDYNGTGNVSGGFLVVSGVNSNMTQAISTSSAQYGVKVTTNGGLSAGTIFHIEDAEGNDIVTFKPGRNYSSIIFSSPGLKNGATYSVFTGGKSTGTSVNGLITGGTYSGGTLRKSFTVSNKVTSVTI